MAKKNIPLDFAEESEKTKKAREKLKKKFQEIDKKITATALEKKTIEIHRWIARHASQRVILKTKSISLFDENQNTAKFSPKVHVLARKIHGELEKFQVALKEKKIRVSSKSESSS
ncbi:MAG: hypothetical protein Tsb0015_13490 [Simkaniaceae bacterium]